MRMLHGLEPWSWGTPQGLVARVSPTHQPGAGQLGDSSHQAKAQSETRSASKPRGDVSLVGPMAGQGGVVGSWRLALL